jgi:hypothetical protein
MAGNRKTGGQRGLFTTTYTIALTADTATTKNPDTGSLTTYRKHNKPALGPLGDSLDDFK